MDEREILLKYLERGNLHIAYKDFYSNKLSRELQVRLGISQWRHRPVTADMISDDVFWASFQKTSTYRACKKDQRFKTLAYIMRRDAYDLVRKDALANAKSDD